MAEVCRRHTDAAVGTLLMIMQDHKQPARERIHAAEIILARGHGVAPAGIVAAAPPERREGSAREWVMAKLRRLQEVAVQQAAAATEASRPAAAAETAAPRCADPPPPGPLRA